MEIPSTVYTHAGKFHADDVFSTALLRLLRPELKVIRTAALPENFEGFAFDIGWGAYDHHQKDAPVRENGVPYAAFGLLWKNLGEQLVGEEWQRFDEHFIQPLDLEDNTGCGHPLAAAIASFNPLCDNVISHIPGNLYKSEKRYKEVEIPTDEQVEKFLVNITDGNKNEFNIIRNIAIVQLIKGSGIRSEELINMDISDLHLHEEKRPYMMILGKGNIQEYDKVYMSEQARMNIEEYLKIRTFFVTEREIKDNALFLSNENNRLSKGAITGFFNLYSEGEIYPHMLRHWVGSKLYEETKDIVLVQRQLRHKNLETAARYYYMKRIR